MAIKVKVEGFRELDKALQQLKVATAKNVARRVLMKAAEPIAEDMRARAPDDPDTGGNDLKSSIGVGTKLTKRQSKANKRESPVEVFVGAGGVPQAHLQEFGTEHHVAQPFARPAWDAGKSQALETIRDELTIEIGKAATRAARKAARDARKMGG
ncbi:HK97-gp10 family putative phage morphogenesis protein [Ensifer sp. 1H6]|uniref:HK97-gp10 family putative phage morphogenesis protein n=1 Tax=Ensifer sp. 1H6 TaxID=1911585 RepID=UPI0009C952DD|nr:HK97-gp10 family putative phage morphogenesis protein [Ensifer sp. 1H6]OMQ44930.1 hypothetical protein BKP54_11085 [Ensifer sp. 1H6]